MSKVRMHFNPKENWASTEQGRKKLLDALMNHSLQPSMGIGNHDPSTLPRRYLPPGSYSDLFRLYQAECLCLDTATASSSTFFRILRNSGWKAKIKFRGASTHAQCRVCHKLKSKVRCSKDIGSHAEAADRYMRHLGGVFADRQVYAQTKVRAKVQGDILCCIVDSMDKTTKICAGKSTKATGKQKKARAGVYNLHHARAFNQYLLGRCRTKQWFGLVLGGFGTQPRSDLLEIPASQCTLAKPSQGLYRQHAKGPSTWA